MLALLWLRAMKNETKGKEGKDERKLQLLSGLLK
jgi:hypothetical protein